VAYAPVDRLYFLIPESLIASGDIQIHLGNRALELRDIFSAPQGNVPENWRRKIIQLPEPRFQLQLRFQYSLPPLTVPADVTALHTLSFICPADVPVSNHSIHLFASSDYRVELQDESRQVWESFRDPRRPTVGTVGTFRSAQSPTNIALSISVSERSGLGATIVERAWLQTWLVGTIRHDRATYRLKSANDSVAIQLPPDSTQEHRVVVRVNRQEIQANISPTGILTIPILPEQHNRPIEVSVEYRYSFRMSGMEVPIILPAFMEGTLIQYEFWQVILHQNTHIIAASGGWTLEYDWNWNGLFLGRVPSIRKSDIGFTPNSPEEEAIIARSSQYLFSQLHPSRHVTLYVVDRSHIILFSSGIALAIGLILIYVRQSRYVGSLFGLGMALFAALLYQPPLVLLMLQASVFGVFLALGTGYVYRIFHRQKSWVSPAFPAYDDMSQPYITTIPQTVHEVIIDESASKDNDIAPSVINNHNGSPPDAAGQS
jgi:hypothetical protein